MSGYHKMIACSEYAHAAVEATLALRAAHPALADPGNVAAIVVATHPMGETLIRIGVALCLGFVLPQNFNYLYAAAGFTDFWRRWHITLSTWLRDYLYIPLGGNRKGATRMYIALIITMLLGGLWHGANWTFVVWGGLHGLYLWVERFFRKDTARLTTAG